MEYKPGLPVYQPKFEAWLSAHGFAPDCPLADLPKNWKTEYMVWSVANKYGDEKLLTLALDRDAGLLASEF